MRLLRQSFHHTIHKLLGLLGLINTIHSEYIVGSLLPPANLLSPILQIKLLWPICHNKGEILQNVI